MIAIRACLWQENNWWIAHGQHILVATQGGSQSEALENFSEALLLDMSEPSACRPILLHAPTDAIAMDMEVPDFRTPALKTGEQQQQAEQQINSVESLDMENIESTSCISFREVRFKLQAAGFNGILQRPNHAKFIRQMPASSQTAILPHYTELSGSVVRSILCQTGLTWNEFSKLKPGF